MLNLSLALDYEECFSIKIFFIFPAVFLGFFVCLFLSQEELGISLCLLALVSHLEQQCVP